MPDHVKDAVISIPTAHKAWLESWLLGHGFLANHNQASEDGAVTFYSVKEISAEHRNDLSKIGAEVVSEWKPGEMQPSTE